MEERVLLLIASAILALLNGVVMWKLQRKAKESDRQALKLEELEHRLNGAENACAICRSALLTEDKIRMILQEYFDRFELKLINQGRLQPVKARSHELGRD